MIHDFAIVWSERSLLLSGLANTAILSALAAVAALALGIVLAPALMSRRRVIAGAAQTLVDGMRCIPFLLFAYIIYYGLPSLGLRFDNWSSGLVALIVYNTAYMAEILRGAGPWRPPRSHSKRGRRPRHRGEAWVASCPPEFWRRRAFSKLGGSPGGDPARSYQSIGHDLVGGRSPASRGVRHAVVLIAVVHAMPDFTAHDADVLEMPVVERLELGDHALLVAVFGEPGGKPRQNRKAGPTPGGCGKIRSGCRRTLAWTADSGGRECHCCTFPCRRRSHDGRPQTKGAVALGLRGIGVILHVNA